MKNDNLPSLFKLNAIGVLCASVAYSMPTIAQTTNETGYLSLEEIVVTGRKREESLQDIPVSISVLGGDVLAEQNILTQGDLAELVPGLFYNEGNGNINDRIAALPGIRGITSNEIATNRAKVSSFVDGMPILGSVGSINIGGATQVEVYSGPQSAAFGRSTFAGAINYVTTDPAEELEGTLGLNWSNEGTRIVNGSLSGPLTDTLGFHLAGQFEDSVSPDSDIYTYSDGVEAGTRGGTNASARFVFEPTDYFKAKLTFSHDETDDGPEYSFYATQASSRACFDSFDTTFILDGGMGPETVGVDGVFDCELDLDTNANLQAVNDIVRYYEQNTAEYDALITGLRADGATDGEFGYTVEEAVDIIATAFSVPHEDVGSQSERDRVSLQMDYLFDGGSAIQLSVMTSEEEYIRRRARFASEEPLVIGYSPAAPAGVDPMSGMATPATDATYTYADGLRGRIYADADPSVITEDYMELRWASPAEERLRYVVGGSYYSYDFLTTTWGNGGYGAVANGITDDLLTLTGFQVAPRNVLSEETENTALFFNASYDFTDTVTGSFEGRYSSDKVGATGSGVTRFQTTNTFVPRIGLNWTPAENTTYYVQYGIGINPAGVNADLLAPATVTSLDGGVAVDDTIYGSGAAAGTINSTESYVNYDSEDYVTFDEEELTNYEFGFKGTALDGRLSYTGAVYHMIWKDAVQSTDLDWDYTYATGTDALVGTLVAGTTNTYYVEETVGTSTRVYANNGDSETTGIEFQAAYQLTDNWSINGNTSLMKAEYTDFCNAAIYEDSPLDRGAYAGLDVSVDDAGNDCYVVDGNNLERQPALTVSLTPSYRTEFDNGMRFSGTARLNYQGKQYSDQENVQEIPAITTVNLTLGLSKDAWSGTFYVDNLFDDRTITNGGFFDSAEYAGLYDASGLDPALYIPVLGTNYSSISYNINEGRSYGLRLNYNF